MTFFCSLMIINILFQVRAACAERSRSRVENHLHLDFARCYNKIKKHHTQLNKIFNFQELKQTTVFKSPVS